MVDLDQRKTKGSLYLRGIAAYGTDVDHAVSKLYKRSSATLSISYRMYASWKYLLIGISKSAI